MMDAENSSVTEKTSYMQDLKDQCEGLWLHIHQTHARLRSRAENMTCFLPGEENLEKIHEEILKAKEKRLQAEYAAIESSGVEVPSMKEEYLDASLKQQLAQNTSQLDDTLLILKSKRKEIAEQLEREKEILEQHKDIEISLLNKTKKIEDTKENFQSGTSKVRELERKQRIAETQLKQVMKKLGVFLREHFPLPTLEDVEVKRKTVLQGEQTLDPTINYVTLQEMLEELMNTQHDRPHDPYMQLQPHHWPPYVELLLRCGLVLRHNQDSNQIKLESFNV
ncbi:centromere protein K isoform X1 [Nematostella vectensis]|uniref:centromere protein K isoform X1 n=1 Tax=Nematostella vectensis TaxID=45351 RepID=UPI002076E2F0|nr:centromere protein K isoform X1 [Nematostella vectensis]XP_032232162.2 centromere protein K isoform X1 [Nematostella vectensis]